MRFRDLLRVDLDELGSILVVHEDVAFAVGDGEFGFAAKSERASHGAIGRIDGCGVLAPTIEGENALADGIVDDGIRIDVGLNRTDGLQRFQVEDGYIVRTAVAGEAATEFGSDGDAMNALGVCDIANDFERIRVQHDNLGSVRDVDAASVAVYIDVIPAAFTADGNSIDPFVSRRAWGGGGSEQKCTGKECNSEACGNCENCDAFIVHKFLFLC